MAEALEAALPPDDLSALLASERDLDDFDAAAQKEGPLGDRYGEIAELAPSLIQERRRYELLFSTVYDELSRYQGGPREEDPFDLGPLAERGEIVKPSLRDLRYSHPYALDVFFTRVEQGPGGQRGPEIRSLSGGIVIGAAGDWKGGAGARNYRGGGLSPNSGNGVVVYDPRARRYYSYFHLSETALETGDLVRKGTAIGRGGNTGANARKPGHGGHVHVEIFDAPSGRPLSGKEIRSLLF
jgi:murein DD-endopeptidase MepM/ murein hydrolase activator NlpD